MDTAWESELANFLSHLSTVQEQTLEALARKRDLLAKADTQGLAALENEEDQLVGRLQECLDQRQRLLDRASQEGLPATSIRSLAQSLPTRQQDRLSDSLRHASHRARLLQHHSLVNWVLVQKALIHLSQLLEIIATGGRLQPTYQRDGTVQATGALVDRAA
jgi:hypothetical protein